MTRRSFLGGVTAVGLTGCARQNKTAGARLPPPPPPQGLSPQGLAPFDAVPKLAAVRAEVDRIFRITVCLRPFRAAGPRLDVERVGDKTVIHNYGHGGSGWSLSWGSSSMAVEKAMGLGERDVAVIGCGALGLTSAILLQRA